MNPKHIFLTIRERKELIAILGVAHDDIVKLMFKRKVNHERRLIMINKILDKIKE